MGFFIYVMDNFFFCTYRKENVSIWFRALLDWKSFVGKAILKLKSNENNNKKMENHYYEEGLGM